MSTIAEAEKAVKFNVFYAKKNVVDSIWKEAIIEGVNITYPQLPSTILNLLGIISLSI